MNNLINYIQLLNQKRTNNKNQNRSDINSTKKMVHYRRDLDSLGECLNVEY